MQVYPNRFQSEINKRLAPCYLLFGDEPQQKFEMLESVRQTAKNAGFDERTLLVADSDFSWNSLIEATQTLSLFSTQQLIELELPTGKPGAEGSKTLIALAENLSPDTLLVIHGPRIGKDVQKAKWFKALDAIGVFAICYALEGKQLHAWIQQQINQYQLQCNTACIKLIADYCEGNLLAARQEIEKLSLLFPHQNINEKDIEKTLIDQSRYNVFQLVDVMLNGELQRTVKMLYRLESEGIEPNIIIWALIREWQTLSTCLQYTAKGQQPPWPKLGIWRNRQGFYQNALQHLTPQRMHLIQQQLAQADLAFKQTSVIRPFVKLCHLCLLFMPVALDSIPLDAS
jgi:DNA polymerase-3 subunit delta